MTENCYITETYIRNNTTYGGKIYNGDYDNYHSMCDMAKRIASDLKFDKQCRKNTIARDENQRGNK